MLYGHLGILKRKEGHKFSNFPVKELSSFLKKREKKEKDRMYTYFFSDESSVQH